MDLQLDGSGPLYEQLARALRQAIVQGRWRAGQRLPSTRSLARTLQISRNTVLSAYELLAAQQLAVATEGSGTRVSESLALQRARGSSQRGAPPSRYAERARALGPIRLARRVAPTRYNLQYGEPLINLPMFNAWRTKLAAAALRTDPSYPVAAGLPGLRQAVSRYLARRRGVRCDPEDVIIVQGAQQALSLVARVVVNEGDPVVIEDPHYQLALQALRAHGARIHVVSTDAQGLKTDELPVRGARLLYATPAHQFPSGVLLSQARRVELLRWAHSHDCWILEDDYDGEFHYGVPAPPTLRSLDTREGVIYVGTFSKCMNPSLRLGYLVAPPRLRADLVMAKLLEDLGSPAIEQNAMAAFLNSGGFERHLKRATAELTERRAVLLEGLHKHAGEHLEVNDSRAGMHVVGWCRRLDYRQLDHLVELAGARGLGLHPIHPFYLKPPPRPGLLLGFAGLSPAQLRAATRLLGRCFAEL